MKKRGERVMATVISDHETCSLASPDYWSRMNGSLSPIFGNQGIIHNSAADRCLELLVDKEALEELKKNLSELLGPRIDLYLVETDEITIGHAKQHLQAFHPLAVNVDFRGNRGRKFQLEKIFIEAPRFFGIVAAVRNVMKRLDDSSWNGFRPGDLSR